MDIRQIHLQVDEILDRLQQLAIKRHDICCRVDSDNEAYSDFMELGELHNKAEVLRRQLESLKDRSRLDGEVMEIEKKLDEALRRYYWLWQKCKENLDAEPH